MRDEYQRLCLAAQTRQAGRAPARGLPTGKGGASTVRDGAAASSGGGLFGQSFAPVSLAPVAAQGECFVFGGAEADRGGCSVGGGTALTPRPATAEEEEAGGTGVGGTESEEEDERRVQRLKAARRAAQAQSGFSLTTSSTPTGRGDGAGCQQQ